MSLFATHIKTFVPRPYQAEAISQAVEFYQSDKKEHAIEILPTGSGKSVVIAGIASKLEGRTIVFQPSKEILEQNVAKYCSYGYRAGVYSASAGMKQLDKVTFATIGSVARKHHLFKQFQNIIIDEAHLTNAKGGMYNDFIESLSHAKVLGLTATPYRLTTTMEGAMLKFLTRTRPRIFSKVLYYVQNDVLFNAGHLSKLEYFNFDVINRSELQTNSTGTDFTESSLRIHAEKVGLVKAAVGYAVRILSKRNNLLIFCSLVSEAYKMTRFIEGSVVITGETEKAKREKYLAQFKSGAIRCVINVGVLTTGFDYPELEAILIARSTMSLALYYQIIGRVMRPHQNKETGWVVDLGGNVKFFGKIETMKIHVNEKGLFSIWNNGRQLTNVPFQKM